MDTEIYNLSECKVPLLWNANGVVEIIQQDDISQDEADRFVKILECNMVTDSDVIFRPSSCSSNDISSESDCQEKLSLDNDEEIRYDCYSPVDKKRNIQYADGRSKRNITVKNEKQVIFHKSSRNVQDDRVHVCNICGKRFSRKFNLNTHIKCVHSDDKDYVCTFCERAFNHSSNLRKHIKTVHGAEKRLLCSICKKPFKHTVALNNHIKFIHGQDNEQPS